MPTEIGFRSGSEVINARIGGQGKTLESVPTKPATGGVPRLAFFVVGLMLVMRAFGTVLFRAVPVFAGHGLLMTVG